MKQLITLILIWMFLLAITGIADSLMSVNGFIAFFSISILISIIGIILFTFQLCEGYSIKEIIKQKLIIGVFYENN